VPTPDTIDAFLRLGVAGLLAVAVIAFVREIIVPGSAYKRVLAERDAAYQRLARILDVVEATTGVKVRTPDE
jgi:hypothetical protein